MDLSDCWFTNPDITATSYLVAIIATFITIGKFLIPRHVFVRLQDDMFAVIFILLIFYFSSKATILGIFISLALLLLFVSIQASPSGEAFCPYQPPVPLYSEENTNERCNYTLHPELHKNENVPTMVTTPSSEMPMEDVVQNLSFDAYIPEEDGADFNASFQ
jgi:hypothetical protein